MKAGELTENMFEAAVKCDTEEYAYHFENV